MANTQRALPPHTCPTWTGLFVCDCDMDTVATLVAQGFSEQEAYRLVIVRKAARARGR